jgi:hypothetical protein
MMSCHCNLVLNFPISAPLSHPLQQHHQQNRLNGRKATARITPIKGSISMKKLVTKTASFYKAILLIAIACACPRTMVTGGAQRRAVCVSKSLLPRTILPTFHQWLLRNVLKRDLLPHQPDTLPQIQRDDPSLKGRLQTQLNGPLQTQLNGPL